MTIPHITIEQANVAFSGAVVPLTLLEIYNNRIDAHNAQPEPVDPHAALRAEYAKQIAEGTTGFHLWEASALPNKWTDIGIPDWSLNLQYRCKDISCYVSKDGEPAIRMLRTEAQALQAELGDTVEWVLNGFTKPSLGGFDFGASGIYTYKLKSNLVKLDGKLMTRETATAKYCQTEKGAFDLLFKATKGKWDLCQADFSHMQFRVYAKDGEYELRAKPAKMVLWADVPVGVMTNHGLLLGVREGIAVLFDHLKNALSFVMPDELRLAPAADQPWIAVQDDKRVLWHREQFKRAGLAFAFNDMRFRITGLLEGYEMEGSK